MPKRDENDLGHPAAAGPILLTDIDRVLSDSAGVGQSASAAPIRVWRDELTLALESLAFARAVLAADVGILRRCLAAPDQQAVVDELPAAMAGQSWGDGWAAPEEPDRSRVNWEVFARADRLMSTHEEMASADLSSTEDVTRVLGDLEGQLTDLARRQEAVEVRLAEIRSAIVHQYERGGVPARDWLG
jgi:hypothetical protein